MSEAEAWTYPPTALKPDPNRPVRLIERKGRGLFIQFYDVEGRLHELPLVLAIFPPEFQQLRSQLPLQDFWQVLSQNIKSSEIMVPVDIQDSYIMVPTEIQSLYPGIMKSSFTLLASTTQTASGSGSDVDIGNIRNLDIEIKVTNVSGTSPVLNIYIQGKQTATGDYFDIASYTNITAAGNYRLSISNCPYRIIRVRWEIGGTSPSFTFQVVAEGSV